MHANVESPDHPPRSTAWSLRATLLLVAATLSGCQVLVRESDTGAWVDIPPGSTLTLNRAITMPKDRARVFFRGGRVSAMGASLGPSCGLEVRRIDREAKQSIPAGTYPITRVQAYWAQVAAIEARSLIRFRLAQATDGGGNPMVQEGYHLWLDGGPDSNVMRLTCLGMLDDLPDARPPTLAEIRSALGGLATLELAQTQ